MDDNKINVGGRLHSIATGNILTGANEIFDDDKNKKQSDINTETYILVNEVNAKLDTLSPEQQSALDVATKANKNEANLGYYVCETEANVAAKVVANATGYILASGGSIKIKMNNANTADNATLNINSTGANPLYYNGERASASNSWEAGETVEVYYDGTNFYANNVEGSGKFASGENVKTVGIDSEPTAGSDNLVKSGGVRSLSEYIYGLGKVSKIDYIKNEWLDSTNTIISSVNGAFYRIKVSGGEHITIKKALGNEFFYCMIVKDYSESHSLPYTPTFATGETGRRIYDFDMYLPEDATDVLIAAKRNVDMADCLPGTLIIGEIDYLKGFLKELDETKADYDYINGFKSLSNFRGKKISIIGDSISTFNKDGYKIPNYRMYYPYGDVTNVNQTYWKKLIDLCGGELEVNASWSGSHVTNFRSSEGYPNFYDRTSAGFLGNPDIIIVELGQNDAARGTGLTYGKYEYDAELSSLDESFFIPAYIKGIRALKNNYPNASIWCIITNYTGTSGVNCKTIIRNIANHYNIPCVDVSGYDQSGVTTGHPSAFGMQYIANKISDFYNHTNIFNDIDDLKLKSNNIISTPLVFEQGGLSYGIEVENEHRIRSGFIDIDSFVAANVNANYVLWAITYDKNKNYISYTKANRTKLICSDITDSNVKYIRFLIANTYNSVLHSIDDNNSINPSAVTDFVLYTDKNIEIVSKESKDYTDELVQRSTHFSLINNAILDNYYIKPEGIPVQSQNWTRYRLKADGIVNITFKVFSSLNTTTYPYKAISFYNSENVFDTNTLISSVAFGEYTSGTMSEIVTVPQNCKTIFICTRNADTPENGVVIIGFINNTDILKVINEITEENTKLQNEISNIKYDSIGNAEFWLDSITSAFSDMVWVNNRLIGFGSSSDDLTEEGTIYILEYANGIKNQKTNYFTLKHLFGHCNTVDYRKEIDCLILGNGSGDYSLTGKIIIIPNFSQIVGVSASSSIPITLTDANALVIDCSSYNLGGKFNLIWGDDNDKNYNIAYLITANIDGSTSSNGGDLETIRKIVLRKGEEQGEYGSIVENNTPFNGTFDIVETSHQTTDGYPNCDQGTCYYKGEIYACIGHDGLWYWRMRMSNGKIFKNNYKQQTYYANKPQNFGNASGICVKDGYLFIGRFSIGIMAIQA